MLMGCNTDGFYVKQFKLLQEVNISTNSKSEYLFKRNLPRVFQLKNGDS